MIGLEILNIGLTALVGSLCTVLYVRLQSASDNTAKLKKQVAHLEVCMHELVGLQTHINKSVNNLAKDILHREVYQSLDDRHHMAIKAAKEGRGRSEIVRLHGLSSDEAALIVALHGVPSATGSSAKHNASLEAESASELVGSR